MIDVYYFGLMVFVLLCAIVASVALVTNKDELGKAKVEYVGALVSVIFFAFLWAIIPTMSFKQREIDQRLISSPVLLEEYLYETHETLERIIVVLRLLLHTLTLAAAAFSSVKLARYLALRRERKAKESHKE